MYRALLVLLALLAIAPTALAQTPSGDACGAGTLAWIARCNASQHAAITRAECPVAGLFVVTTDDARIELNRYAQRSFRQANGWGLSLVNENAAWESLAASKRSAFERVFACVAADGSLPTTGASPEALRALRGSPPPRPPDPHSLRSPLPSRDDHGHAAPPPPRRSEGRSEGRSQGHTEGRSERRHGGSDARGARWILPWRLLVAAALLVAAWWPHRRRRLPRLPARLAAVVGVSLATLVARWWVFGPNFFHQNGQGPMWVDSAVAAWLPYGSGFSELFNLAVRLHPAAPDLALFAAQGLLAGLALCAAWSLCRRCQVPSSWSALLPTGLVFGLAVHPTLGRMAVSESYFAAGLSLELLGAWALTHGQLPRGATSAKLRAVAPTVAGALLLSLAVGVHPATWLPAASVPLVLLATPGSLRRRLKRLALTYAIVGAVVLVTAGSGVLEVLRGELGQRWAHQPPVNTAAVHQVLLACLAVTVVAVGGARRPLRALVRMLPVFPLAMLGPMTDVITPSGAHEHIASAFFWLHVPVVLAGVAAALGDLPRRASHAYALAALVALGGLGWSAAHFRALTFNPTDDLELRALLRWRERLPAGATVAWLSRAENHILAFPLYPSTDVKGRRLVPLTAQDAAAALPTGDGAYWYRASVCTTEEGRAFCERIERGATLVPVVTATYPARYSLSHLPFDRERVPVGLYRVRPSARETR